MVTGSAGILAFIFGCILIHLAIMINSKFNENISRSNESDLSIQELMGSMYTNNESKEKKCFAEMGSVIPENPAYTI